MDRADPSPAMEIAQPYPARSVPEASFELIDWVELGRLCAVGRIEEALLCACGVVVEQAPAELCAALVWRGRRLELVAVRARVAAAEVPVEALARVGRRVPVAVVGDGVAYAARIGRRTYGVLFVRGPSVSPLAVAVSGWVASALARVEREDGLARAVRESRRELRTASSQLRRLERLGSRASHDLKAPLVAIKGYVDMILRGMGGVVDPKTERYLIRVNSSVDRMKELIESRVHPTSTRRLSDLGALFEGRTEAIWAAVGPDELELLRGVLGRGGKVESSVEGVAIRLEGLRERAKSRVTGIAARAGGTVEEDGETVVVRIPRLR